MKHAGKATSAALKIIHGTLFILLAILLASLFARLLGEFVVHVAGALVGIWVLLGLFCFYFFRDPEAHIPLGPALVVSPAHGKVDLIDETDEPEFMGGRCRRISIFLSVFDVHVQRSPVSGRIAVCKHTRGRFLNAIKSDSAAFNENVLVGIDSSEKSGERIGVRLIAGFIARRIVPWVQVGDEVRRGDRISLIQFGSRCDIYLPVSYQVSIQLNQHVKGGETILAQRS